MKKFILLLLLLSGLIIKPLKSSAQLNVQDSIMLVNLYDSTNGAGWINKTNWLTGSINWHGAYVGGEVSGGFKVSDIQLSSNNLVGVIPSTLGNDSLLQELDLSHNQLTGTIPFSLTVLDRDSLLGLDLSYNHLSGSVPSSLGNDSVLTYLDLSHNQFTFAGMEAVAKLSPPAWGHLSYAPQANIHVVQEGGKLTVSAGGTLSNNTYKWYNGNTLMATITGDSTFTPIAVGNYSVAVTNAIATQLTLYSDTVSVDSIVIQLCSEQNDTLVPNLSGASYQWQVNNGSGFINIDGAKPYPWLYLFYFFGNTPEYGIQYRCIVDGDTSTVYTIIFVDTWTGAVSNAWENEANWSCGNVPDSNTDAIIPNGVLNFPVLNSNTSVRSLTVSPNASFTIASPYNLTVVH